MQEAHSKHKELGTYQRRSYQRPPVSGPEAGLNRKIDYWQTRDARQEVNILTAQALNPAVQATPRGTITEQIILTTEYIAALTELRSSGDLRETCLKYHNISKKR